MAISNVGAVRGFFKTMRRSLPGIRVAGRNRESMRRNIIPSKVALSAQGFSKVTSGDLLQKFTEEYTDVTTEVRAYEAREGGTHSSKAYEMAMSMLGGYGEDSPLFFVVGLEGAQPAGLAKIPELIGALSEVAGSVECETVLIGTDAKNWLGLKVSLPQSKFTEDLRDVADEALEDKVDMLAGYSDESRPYDAVIHQESSFILGVAPTPPAKPLTLGEAIEAMHTVKKGQNKGKDE